MKKYNQVLKLWQSFKIERESDLEKYLEDFRILFAYHSGKIENDEIDYHDTREIFENGKVEGFSGHTKTLFEQQNQKKCYQYLLPKIMNKEVLTIEFINEIHRILCEGTYDEKRYIENGERPGEFKKSDYVTGKYEVGSSAGQVEDELKGLLIELNDVEADFTMDNILKIATYLHARFESIHPYADGNGRVGRTLLNYYLMIHNHPPIIIYEEDRKLYYDCLEKYDVEEDINSLLEFLRYELEKTWDKKLKLQDGDKRNSKKLKSFL